MKGLIQAVERLEESLAASARPTAIVWAWPTREDLAVGNGWGVTFLGGDARERRRMLAQLRRDPVFQVPPSSATLPRSRDGLAVVPYVPRPLQLALHRAKQRVKVVVTHRRFGKTLYGLAELLRAACDSPGPSPTYAFVAPYRNQAKAVAWSALRDLAGGVPGVMFNESELRCDLPGQRRVMLLGADNPDALRGIGLDGAVLDEYGFADPEVFGRVIRPALTDRQGFVIFIGTPHGRNHFAQLYDRASTDPDSLAVLYTASQSHVLDPAELARAREDMSPDEYASEFEAKFESGVRGAYYGALIDQAREQGRIRHVPYQPQAQVSTYWDIGVSDSTAIIFTQRLGSEVHIIDYLEGSGEGLQFYLRELQRKPYLYSAHWLPPDAAARQYAAGAESLVAIAGRLGLRPVRIAPRVDVETGIEKVRLLLPRVWFDAERCSRLLDALGAYRKAWDSKHQVYTRNPLHDWSSHAADAMRYMAIVLRDPDREDRPRQKSALSIMSPSPFRPAESGPRIKWPY
jgi:phage terminase large subunit